MAARADVQSSPMALPRWFIAILGESPSNIRSSNSRTGILATPGKRGGWDTMNKCTNDQPVISLHRHCYSCYCWLAATSGRLDGEPPPSKGETQNWVGKNGSKRYATCCAMIPTINSNDVLFCRWSYETPKWSLSGGLRNAEVVEKWSRGLTCNFLHSAGPQRRLFT